MIGKRLRFAREAIGLYELLWIIGALSFLFTTAVMLYVALYPAAG
jgi:hypothetical protein